jgi:isoleucyl-tRNA synthetase
MEALAREIVRRIQIMRKELNLNVSDFIEVFVESDSEDVRRAVSDLSSYISKEVRATRLSLGAGGEGYYTKTWDVEGLSVRIAIKPTNRDH